MRTTNDTPNEGVEVGVEDGGGRQTSTAKENRGVMPNLVEEHYSLNTIHFTLLTSSSKTIIKALIQSLTQQLE